MVFTAKLLRGSPIWRLWREHARTGGDVMGVQFRWAAGNDYVTEALTLEQITALRGANGVVLEGHGHDDVVAAAPPVEPEEMDDDATDICRSIAEVAAELDKHVQDIATSTPPQHQHLSKRERRMLRQQQAGNPHV